MDFKKAIPVSDLLTSTSIALGEAYMDGDLEIEGNLYEALDHFRRQIREEGLEDYLTAVRLRIISIRWLWKICVSIITGPSFAGGKITKNI